MFGIQSRAGCACAGPFGHELLGIEKSQSQKYVKVIEQVLEGLNLDGLEWLPTTQ